MKSKVRSLPFDDPVWHRPTTGKQDAKADSAKVDSTKQEKAATAKADAAAALKSLSKDKKGAEAQTATAQPNKARAAALKAHPLLSLFAQPGYPKSCIVGYATALDTAAINRAVRSELAAQVLPADLNLAWGAAPRRVCLNSMPCVAPTARPPWPAM